MFHRLINHNGEQVDVDRAMWLMDKTVLAEAAAILPPELGQAEFDRFIATRMGFAPAKPRTNAECLQALWDEYCRLHLAKYGAEFSPSVM